MLKPQQGNSFRSKLIQVWSLSASGLINNTEIELVVKTPLHLRLLIQNSFRSRHKLLLRSSKTWQKPGKLNVQARLHDLQHLLSVLDVSGTDKYLKIYWYLFVWLQYADKKKFASSTLLPWIRKASSKSSFDISKCSQTIFSQTFFNTILVHRLIGLDQLFFPQYLIPI